MNQAPFSINDSALAVELSDVWKSFPGVTANAGVNLRYELAAFTPYWERMGLGINLMNILAGVYRPDSGELRIHGQSQQFRNPADALSAGIGMVHQEFRLIPSFSVAENVILGSAPRVLRTNKSS